MKSPFHWVYILLAACLGAVSVTGGAARAAFNLQMTVNSPGSFTAHELQLVNEATARAEAMWETMITGYQPGISIASVPITINPTNSGLAAANFSSSTLQGGFTLPTSGYVTINTLEIENFGNWQGDEPNGLNFLDELLAHEIGHVLGIGTLWTTNNVYQNNTFQYTGQYGVAAYVAEFGTPNAFAPVENAGNAGTPNSHWDQLMRSSSQEGTNGDVAAAFLLDPRVGVLDQYGRDRALELMTGAIDPDFREPFVSRFTVQSLRDMGYSVTEFEDFNGDGLIDLADRAIVLANQGMTGLQIDGMRFGDADRDRDVDMVDFRLWQVAAGVPEPSGLALACLAMAAATAVRRHTAL